MSTDVRQVVANARGIIFDIDGSIVLGRSLVPGAADTIERLRRQGKRILFLSNDSDNSTEEVCTRLKNLGLGVDAERVVTPVTLAGDFVSERFGCTRVAVLGSPALRESLIAAGHVLCETGAESCDVVLTGRDRLFTFTGLECAATHIQRGSRFVATNLDFSHPLESGILSPQTGSLVAAISAVCGEAPELIGKPSAYMFRQAQSRLGLESSEILMVGDNPFTDIAGGNQYGLTTILLRGPLSLSSSPLTRRFQAAFQDFRSGIQTPDYEVRSLRELL